MTLRDHLRAICRLAVIVGVAVLFWGCIVFAAFSETLVIKPGSAWSDGGYVRQYLRKRDNVDAVEIRGRCVSSCAMFLGHPKSCVSRKAKLGFHAVSYYGAIASFDIQADYARYLGNAELRKLVS